MLFNRLVDNRSNDASQAPSSPRTAIRGSFINNGADLIGALARSDHSDHRVKAALATIALETSPSVETAEAPP